MSMMGGTGKAGVMGAPDRQIAKLIQENRQALDRQVTTEEKILTAKTDYYEFIVDQLNAIELNATNENKISDADLKNIKEFSTKRDQLLDDILNNIQRQATITQEATGATAGSSGGGSSGGGGGKAGVSGGGVGSGVSGGGGAGGGVGSGVSGGVGAGGGVGGSMSYATPSGNVVGRLLEYIGKKESNGNYNILVGGKTEPNLTNMTIAEVLEYQRGMRQRGHESTAVGKYQIIRGTLESLIKEGYASPSDKFNASIQDRLAVGLLKRRGLDQYQAGKISKDRFADNLSKEWASLPYNTGQSYYAGVGSNKSSGSRDQFMTAFARNGGVFAGPDSGYPAVLHGPEAVVPLPDGKTIPVKLENGNEFLNTNEIKNEMRQMMSEFRTAMQGMIEQVHPRHVVNAMDEMVRAQKASVDIQKKMLQASSS
jgi:muramidase (phage lysozyme)